jgi:hypothetical protein
MHWGLGHTPVALRATAGTRRRASVTPRLNQSRMLHWRQEGGRNHEHRDAQAVDRR